MNQVEAVDRHPPSKLLASPRVKLRLAIASGVIVGAGALLAPRASETGLSAPQEHVAPLLEEQVQPREVSRPFRGVQDIVDRVRQHTVAIVPALPQVPRVLSDFSDVSHRSDPSGFGVFISNTHVLTHGAALDGRSSIQLSTADGMMGEARVAAYDTATGLVLLQLTSSQMPELRPATLARERQPTGTLAAAVGRWRGMDISAPVFVTSADTDRYTLGGLQHPARSGMPVFNMDGALFAIAEGASQGQAFAVVDAADRLIARATTGERLVAFGFTFQELDGLLTRVLGERGVLINSVVARGPAGEAGVMTGDVLVGIGSTEIDSVDAGLQAARSAELSQMTTLRILRAGRARTLTVTPATAYEVAAMARADPRAPDSAPEARALFPLPLLDAARIPPSARVASINGRVVSTAAQAQRQLRTVGQPILLLLRYADRQFFAAIERPR